VECVKPSPLPLIAAPLPERERADARRNRERILCAAARLVDERGIDCVSMDDVAAAAGVGKGTLYRRFGDRWTLLRALIDEPERDFQDELIRGAPPLGPGAPPMERLRAFGAGQLALLENHARFMFAGDKIRVGRHDHPVYAFYRVHLAYLLREILGDDARTDYLVDALLAALAADLFLYQREVRGMSLEDLIDGWQTLADAVVATATATPSLAS
jgi:AcrR family transcriptional regulator